jgi:nicotinamide riboside kinase
MTRRARTVALVGAESTGKTTLAQALATRLRAERAGLVAWVPERLREWCTAEGRTPRADEQRGILQEQHARIARAAATHDWVIADTTALMTAVYSRFVFGDGSLDDEAVALHRRDVDLTLLTAIDLPWTPDGLQRDGPQVREPVDQALRLLMQQHGIGFAVVGGQGERRLRQALAALQGRRSTAEPAAPPRTSPEAGGLFTGLSADASGVLGTEAASRRRWLCECCVPEAEQALMRQRRA